MGTSHPLVYFGINLAAWQDPKLGRFLILSKETMRRLRSGWRFFRQLQPSCSGPRVAACSCCSQVGKLPGELNPPNPPTEDKHLHLMFRLKRRDLFSYITADPQKPRGKNSGSRKYSRHRPHYSRRM